jgi:hypothetical protein
LDSPEVVVGEGLDDIEREPVMLVMADSTFLGLVARQGELSSVLIFNTPAVVLTDDNAPNFPRVPLPPRLQGVPHETQANRKARLRAEGRAKALLFRYLVPEQKWELRAYRRITVIGQDGRTYRIYAWHGMNVRLVENGQETYTFCIVPKPEHRLPVFDLILAQKVLIETSLPDFFKLAVQRSYAPS